jgi:hypothetical protein
MKRKLKTSNFEKELSSTNILLLSRISWYISVISSFSVWLSLVLWLRHISDIEQSIHIRLVECHFGNSLNCFALLGLLLLLVLHLLLLLLLLSMFIDFLLQLLNLIVQFIIFLICLF